MPDPKHIHISDYDYVLPPERIAKHPCAQRDQSRLLIYRNGGLSDTRFCHLPDYLPAGALLVFNNTKVIQARLHFRKPTGALIEIFCLEPYRPRDYEQNFQQRGACEWVCLVGNRKKWKSGILSRTLEVAGHTVTLSAELTGETPQDSPVVRLSWDDPELTLSDILEAVGELPIPPYLNRPTEESDRRDYQTVYSKIDGSVAAPTAGLHFTPEVLRAIDAKGIERNELTLHVGAGTFRPVKSDEMAGHEMHSEYIYVPRQTIDALLRHDAWCIAVGTTSVRTLESLYYIGLHVRRNPDVAETDLHVSQWTPYELPDDERAVTPRESLEALRDYMDRHQLSALHTSTQLIIAPGYDYHFVKAIITNFHMPKSTLLLLVAALVGDKWRDIYSYALEHDFRFLSYGDSSLLIPHPLP